MGIQRTFQSTKTRIRRGDHSAAIIVRRIGTGQGRRSNLAVSNFVDMVLTQTTKPSALIFARLIIN